MASKRDSVTVAFIKRNRKPLHYETLPIQYTEIFFSALEIENFIGKSFAEKADRDNTLEQHWVKNKNKTSCIHTPVNPSFAIQKSGMRGYTFHGHVFLMISKMLMKLVVYKSRFSAKLR